MFPMFPTKDNCRHGAIFALSGLVDWGPLDISGANQCEDPLPQSHRPVLGQSLGQETPECNHSFSFQG